MTRDQLSSKIRRCTSLPSPPRIAMKVLEMARTDDVQLKEMTELISTDPALSGKILRTVNSPFYGLTRAVSTISSALVILGTESVKTLILGFSLAKNLHGGGVHGQTQMDYWRRSIYAAAAARLLSQRLGLADHEDIFLAALLQDIGIQVLMQVVPEEYDPLLAATRGWTGRLIRRERAALGLSHCETGLLLAEQWRLPPLLCHAIRWHHNPSGAPGDFAAACRLVHLAGLCAEVFMSPPDSPGDPPASLPPAPAATDGQADSVRPAFQAVRRYARAAFKLDGPACEALLAEVHAGARELTELFEIDIGPQRPYDDILAEATETIETLTLQSQRRAQQMKTQAETDSLTGLANRRKIEEELGSAYGQACEFGQPLSVIFIDADRFKSVNDQHGHSVGDQALVHLARVIESVSRPGGTVGRYGGEEFVLILPEVTVAAATDLAERIRAAVASTPLALPSGPLPLTISAGVAGFDGSPGPYRQPALLVQAADRATYAAKSAGRNTVRVFSPKAKSPPAAAVPR